LATLDPLAALAMTDGERLNDLLRNVETSSGAVESMLRNLVKGMTLPFEDGPHERTDTEPILFPERYEVLVQCADEPQQKELIAELLDDGFTCRALIS
jgi:hypothetical protein